ncbi:MAG TPA: hypothetical protein VJ521_01090 [Acidobacteriota bacterium]|nr:hypothetical protein [Acidobacteriota bacterium]
MKRWEGELQKRTDRILAALATLLTHRRGAILMPAAFRYVISTTKAGIPDKIATAWTLTFSPPFYHFVSDLNHKDH